jgi:hypothetical protein
MLVPHGNCYPILFFREAWEQQGERDSPGEGPEGRGAGAAGGVQGRLRAAATEVCTRAQMEFLVADMSFPEGFVAARHSSLQAKRSAWGYQHMSRFWVKTIWQHPRIQKLEYMLRLDTVEQHPSHTHASTPRTHTQAQALDSLGYHTRDTRTRSSTPPRPDSLPLEHPILYASKTRFSAPRAPDPLRLHRMQPLNTRGRAHP